ncbi:hypothetical protein [Limosilactobacillus mucosae]|uniref:Uncharacterized protein n=1 Tax=Limosilactobacillus mucosae TaxID=97478 RepID=A0AAJ1M9C5_LIMMU|nr:hypothetical protein [Limosilactobacillus mucosae]MDC2828505.1 hypothetical protein [Limosilactobacillus mucosae]MDC2834517.1 hypothetical protein [Limosilactobacillus mucosae]
MKLKAKFIEIEETTSLAEHFLGRIDITKGFNRKFKENELAKLTEALDNIRVELTSDIYGVQVWIYKNKLTDEREMRINYAKCLVQTVIAELQD